MIRPQPARWFECVCARDDAFAVLEALAASGCAEIEWHGSVEARDARDANLRLKEYAELARACRAYWPAPRLRPAAASRSPAEAFEGALARLRAWGAESAAAIANLQERINVIAELAICLLYTSPSPRDISGSRMPSSA